MSLLLDEQSMSEKGITEENFEDVYSLDFTYPSADGTLIELIENGAEQAVTSVHTMREMAN
jgi:Cft2 family RNA processing exonuclease